MSKLLRKQFIPILIFGLLFVMQLVYIVAYSVQGFTDSLDYMTIACIGAMAFSAAIYVLFIRYIAVSDRIYERKMEDELSSNLKHLDDKYFEIIESELAQTRKVRQDLLSHIEQIRLNIGSTTETDNYDSIRAIDDDLGKLRSLHYCDEPIVDMVLTLKKNKTDQESIPMNIKASVSPDITVSKLDLSSVVSNMTDNAIEAALLAKRGGMEPYVNIYVVQKGDFLVIRTENPTISDKRIDDIENLNTTKNDGWGLHGYGIKILQLISERYGGELTVDIKDHVSVFTMMMNCNYKGDPV